MLPHESTSNYNEILNGNSSGSSDTETLLEEEAKHLKNQINKQWEAIERTLYQESGEQVTDSDLLKECKLWRNTFPHFRVKGNQINVNMTQNFKESNKNVQTLQPSLSLNKLNKKREDIKKTVVDGLVQRLITKFNENVFTTENKSIDNLKGAVEVAELCKDYSDNVIKKTGGSTGDNLNEKETFEISDKNKELRNNLPSPKIESYFERGKLFDSIDEIEKEFQKDTMEEKCYEMFDRLEKEFKEENYLNEFETKKQKSCKKEKFEIKSIKPPNGEVIGVDLSEKFAVNRRRSPFPDTMKNYIKPVEIKTKINKKYEALLSKIINKKTGELEPINYCRTQSSGNKPKLISELSENLRFETVPQECNITLPKINKFNNNWLNKSANACHTVEEYKVKSGQKFKKNITPYLRELTPNDIDEKFMNDLKKEMLVKYRRTSMRFEDAENSRRPKIYSHNCEYTHKSLSCGDLPKKKNKHCQKSQMNGLTGNGITSANANLKSRSKSTNLNKNNPKNIVENKNGILPPIESGIIITELTGRPKIGPKISSKKR